MITWTELSTKTRNNLESDYQRKRKEVADRQYAFYRSLRAYLCKDRVSAIKTIIATLNKIDEVQIKGAGLTAVSEKFTDSLKTSILIGAYITVFDNIIDEHRQAYFSTDWHNSVLATLTVSYLGDEDFINSQRVVATANYQYFLTNTYPSFSKQFKSDSLSY